MYLKTNDSNYVRKQMFQKSETPRLFKIFLFSSLRTTSSNDILYFQQFTALLHINISVQKQKQSQIDFFISPRKFQMDNAHERRWPPGLLTLETRQMNRRQYEQVNKKSSFNCC